MVKEVNFNLPEFCFLEGHSHNGDSLKDRTVIQHIRSYSIFELIDLQETLEFNIRNKSYNFEYTNPLGVIEKFILVLHFSLAEDEELDAIFKKTSRWYCKYMSWEDGNILNDIDEERTAIQN